MQLLSGVCTAAAERVIELSSDADIKKALASGVWLHAKKTCTRILLTILAPTICRQAVNPRFHSKMVWTMQNDCTRVQQDECRVH